MSADPGQQQAGAKPLWTIGQITDRPVLGQSGTYVEGKDVEIVFWDGSIEHVQYPKSSYNDGTIGAAAQAAAERHLRVKALAGPMIPPELQAY